MCFYRRCHLQPHVCRTPSLAPGTAYVLELQINQKSLEMEETDTWLQLPIQLLGKLCFHC